MEQVFAVVGAGVGVVGRCCCCCCWKSLNANRHAELRAKWGGLHFFETVSADQCVSTAHVRCCFYYYHYVVVVRII